MKVTLTIIVAWLSALGFFALSFLDARTPGTVFIFVWFVAWPVYGIIILVVVARLFVKWRESGVQTLLALAACCIASPLGTRLGLDARDRRFFEWRLPIYRSVVERIEGTVGIPGFDNRRHPVVLTGTECEAAVAAFAWLDPSNRLVVQFLWAGAPLTHFLYTFVAAGESGQEDVWGDDIRRMQECWYESRD